MIQGLGGEFGPVCPSSRGVGQFVPWKMSWTESSFTGQSEHPVYGQGGIAQTHDPEARVIEKVLKLFRRRQLCQRPARCGIFGIAAMRRWVYSCWGSIKTCSCRSRFDDLAFVKDRDAVADAGDRRKIVGDVEKGHPEICGSVRRKSARISDCVITSSALVASSAIRSAGR